MSLFHNSFLGTSPGFLQGPSGYVTGLPRSICLIVHGRRPQSHKFDHFSLAFDGQLSSTPLDASLALASSFPQSTLEHPCPPSKRSRYATEDYVRNCALNWLQPGDIVAVNHGTVGRREGLVIGTTMDYAVSSCPNIWHTPRYLIFVRSVYRVVKS